MLYGVPYTGTHVSYLDPRRPNLYPCSGGNRQTDGRDGRDRRFFFLSHFYVPAPIWTSCGLMCRPFSLPVCIIRAFSVLSRIGFSIPTARRFSSNVANSRCRALRESIGAQEKVLRTNLYECVHSGDSNSRNWPSSRHEDDSYRDRSTADLIHLQTGGRPLFLFMCLQENGSIFGKLIFCKLRVVFPYFLQDNKI